MQEIIKTKLVLTNEEVKQIIKEHFLKNDIDLKFIEFFGTNLGYIDKDDYMGEPKFMLKRVVCEHYTKVEKKLN
jgi:hypothetical protein